MLEIFDISGFIPFFVVDKIRAQFPLIVNDGYEILFLYQGRRK